jgi:hypothetical protein
LKGAILNEGEKFYTYMRKVFTAIKGEQTKYNWLITDCICYPKNMEYAELLSKEYVWLTGDALTSMIDMEDFQWIWAVLSGFPQNVTLEEVLNYKLPLADGFRGFWETPLNLQHPLADIEIVPWDSSLVLVISKNDAMIDDFMNYFPLAQDLTQYNKQLKK